MPVNIHQIMNGVKEVVYEGRGVMNMSEIRDYMRVRGG
jgi:hypothetical protein